MKYWSLRGLWPPPFSLLPPVVYCKALVEVTFFQTQGLPMSFLFLWYLRLPLRCSPCSLPILLPGQYSGGPAVWESSSSPAHPNSRGMLFFLLAASLKFWASAIMVCSLLSTVFTGCHLVFDSCPIHSDDSYQYTANFAKSWRAFLWKTKLNCTSTFH